LFSHPQKLSSLPIPSSHGQQKLSLQEPQRLHQQAVSKPVEASISKSTSIVNSTRHDSELRQIMKHLLALLTIASFTLHAGDDNPIVGAIRWDGWYGKGGVVKAVEYSLGQPKYHFRLPWFARVIAEGKVSINGDSQVIMEQEINYAAQAGLNYWAFLDYLDESADMSIGLNRYLAAKDNSMPFHSLLIMLSSFCCHYSSRHEAPSHPSLPPQRPGPRRQTERRLHHGR
jgi:hypothetical protein